MRTFEGPSCPFEIDGRRIRTDGSVQHKVSGTSMAGILGLSPWSSPFQVACNLLGLCREDISGKPAIRTGQILEPVVIDYLDRRYPEKGVFLPAEEVFEKREGDHDAWVSDFADPVFAGHVDGIVMSRDENAEERILEIKTSSNMDSWVDGVPVYYYWQVALYNEFLTQKDNAFVGLGIVNMDTYRDPQSWVPCDRNVMLFDMQIDRADVQAKMEQIRDWYREYILKGVTPEYDPENPKDVEMFDFIKGLADDIEDVRTDVDELDQCEREIADIEERNKAVYERRDVLKDRIKQYMVYHSMSAVDGSSKTATLSKQVRTTLDKKLLLDDGIDPEKYSVKSETNMFKMKKRK